MAMTPIELTNIRHFLKTPAFTGNETFWYFQGGLSVLMHMTACLTQVNIFLNPLWMILIEWFLNSGFLTC